MDFYGKIENIDGLPPNMQEIITTTLFSGKNIVVPVWLMGGGQIHKRYFLKAIGDKKYENAFEWCAGHGEIGFEILTSGICKTLTFSDMHPGSTEWCLRNATHLGLADKVTAHTSSTIGALPQDTKWDLVVGNPPNSINPDQNTIDEFELKGWSEDNLIHFARTTWDSDFKTHIEFFKNIGNYITDDADIFITIHTTILQTGINAAKPYGFELIKVHDMYVDPFPEQPLGENIIQSRTDPGLKVAHFKKKILTT